MAATSVTAAGAARTSSLARTRQRRTEHPWRACAETRTAGSASGACGSGPAATQTPRSRPAHPAGPPCVALVGIDDFRDASGIGIEPSRPPHRLRAFVLRVAPPDVDGVERAPVGDRD